MEFLKIDGLDTNATRDYRAGQICAAVTNFSTWKIKTPLEPEDFFSSLKVQKKPSAPIALADPDAQSRLIMSQVFGTTMENAYGKK